MTRSPTHKNPAAKQYPDVPLLGLRPRGQRSHLHLALLSVVVAPQKHLAVFPSSRDQRAVFQNAERENSALVRSRHLLTDPIPTCQSRYDVFNSTELKVGIIGLI